MENQRITNLNIPASFKEKETLCERIFISGGPFYHLTTDGNKQEIIFSDERDFKAGVNFLAICIIGLNVKILAFSLMSNHIHLILEGEMKSCLQLFNLFRRKLELYLRKTGREGTLKGFSCGDLIPITSLEQLRCEIAYVHRNPFVINNGILPHSYLWGDGHLYFNPSVELIPSRKFKDITFTEKRSVIMGRVTDISEEYLVYDGYILPSSFSSYKYGMSFFRDASHYYCCLNRKQESVSVIAQRLGDKIILNDEELFPVAASLSAKMFDQPKIKILASSQKIELAKKLHFSFNASNKQISRILAIDRSIIDNLFP